MNINNLKDGKYFRMLALDQRGSFEKALRKKHSRVTKKLVSDTKKEIADILSPLSSAVLIDPIYSTKLKKDLKVPFLFCLEKSGTKNTKFGKLTELQKGFSVKKAKDLGADAVKLNLAFSHDASGVVQEKQKALVKKVSKDCKKYKIPFLLELIIYPWDNDPIFNKRKPYLIIRAVAEFAKKEYNVDILKLQFPCDLDLFSKNECMDFCRMIDCFSRVPWVLLTAGVDIDTFSEQLKIAMKCGCSGFLAGRAVWQDVLKYKSKNSRQKWLENQGIKNLKRINRIVGK